MYNMHIYFISEPLCCIPETNTTLQNHSTLTFKKAVLNLFYLIVAVQSLSRVRLFATL